MIPWDALAGAADGLQTRLTGRYLPGAAVVPLPDLLTEDDADSLDLPQTGPLALCATPGLAWTPKAAAVLAARLSGREWFGVDLPSGLALSLTGAIR